MSAVASTAGHASSRVASAVLLQFSDSHCHVKACASGTTLQCSRQPFQDDLVTTNCTVRGQLRRLVVCGTHPAVDWSLVANLAHTDSVRHMCWTCKDDIAEHCLGSSDDAHTANPNEAQVTGRCTSAPQSVVIGFGVHPWFVPELPTASETTADTGSGGKEAAPGATPSAPPPPSHEAGAHPKTDDGPGCSCGEGGGGALTESSGAASMTLHDILLELEQRLQQHPTAIVGEIGLDKLRGPSEGAQVAAFVAQMRLAAKYHRPVSVHCVRQYGLLLQLLQDLPAEDTPPAIVLHAFTGSLDIAKSLLKLKNKTSLTPSPRPVVVKVKERIFFGVGSATSLTVKQFVERTLPFLLEQHRALLETDTHYEHDAPRQELTTSQDVVLEPLLALAATVARCASPTPPPLNVAVAGEEGTAETTLTAVDLCEDAFQRAFGCVLEKMK